MKTYQAVIGLEVHAQLQTQSKLFCVAPNSYGEQANSQLGWTSAGLPGSLPSLNIEALNLAIRAGLALNCRIQRKSVFARKNYFYPDLPKGYQISQFDEPICMGGFVEFNSNQTKRRIHLDHIHLEEDAGKLTHNLGSTLVNLNRAGVPLIEIVSKPEIHTPQEAADYLRHLHSILVHSKVSDGNLEEGNFRCDANVSIRPVGDTRLYTRTEIKNVNSFRFVEKAIEFEIARQIAIVEGGGTVLQETRGWDAAANKTFLMRKKEDAEDYRYFPDPDLPVIRLTQEYIDQQRSLLPELPDNKKQRYLTDFKVSESDAQIFINHPEISHYFENVVQLGISPVTAAGWVLTELLGLLKEFQIESVSLSKVTPAMLSDLLLRVEKGEITARSAKKVLRIFFESSENLSVQEIIKKENLSQLVDVESIQNWVDQIVKSFPNEFQQYLNGKDKVKGFLVGEVMKASKGRANPEITHKLVEALKEKKTI